MISEDMNQLAEAVMTLLERKNAVRVEDPETGDDNIPNYVTVREICDELHIYYGDWHYLARYMYNHSYPLCHKPGKGHYIGGKGEQICKVYYRWRMAKGWSLLFKNVDKELRTAPEEGKKWMEKNFNVTDIDEMAAQMEAKYADRSKQSN